MRRFDGVISKTLSNKWMYALLSTFIFGYGSAKII